MKHMHTFKITKYCYIVHTPPPKKKGLVIKELSREESCVWPHSVYVFFLTHVQWFP